MVVVTSEYTQEEEVFGVMDCFNDEAVVSREVEEGPGLAGRAEFGEDVLGGEGEKVVCGVEVEVVFA